MNNIKYASSGNCPLITIITAVYNGEKYLNESIESVINQTYPNIQYIVIDGGSTDKTVDIISKKYAGKIDYWTSEPDQGIYDAWNKALAKAKGDWICFIGADDFFLSPEVIENIASHLNKIGDRKKYVYGKVKYVSQDKSVIIDVIGEDWAHSKKKFTEKMTLVHCGSFHHKSLFKSNGNFDTRFRITGDYEFLLRAYCKNQDFAALIDTPVVGMRTGGISGSLENRLLMAREMNLARKLNGLKRDSFSIRIWILRIRFYMILRKIFGAKLTNYLADLYRISNGKRKRWSVT